MLARRHNLLVLADDVYQLLAFPGVTPPPRLVTYDLEMGAGNGGRSPPHPHPQTHTRTHAPPAPPCSSVHETLPAAELERRRGCAQLQSLWSSLLQL